MFVNYSFLMVVAISIFSLVDKISGQFSKSGGAPKEPTAKKYKAEGETEGVILLDAFTFPKIVPNPRFAVVVIVCNKREFGQYDTDMMRADFFHFAKAGLMKGNGDDVIFAQVIVNGAQNMKLAERIGVSSALTFKHPMLFMYPVGSDKPIAFPNDQRFDTNSLMTFVNKHSSFFLEIPGLIESFSALSETFLEQSEEGKRSALAKAEELLQTLDNKNAVENGKHYIKAMTSVLSKGSEHITNEAARLAGILKSDRVSDGKKADVRLRLNIINSFDRDITKSASDNSNNEL